MRMGTVSLDHSRKAVFCLSHRFCYPLRSDNIKYAKVVKEHILGHKLRDPVNLIQVRIKSVGRHSAND